MMRSGTAAGASAQRTAQSKLGHGSLEGKAKSTGQGYENSIKMFDQFVTKAKAEQIGIGPMKVTKFYDACTSEDLAHQEVFQEIGYFLAKDAVKQIKGQRDKGEDIIEDQNGEPIAMTTALQYFSNYQNAVANRFSDHPFFKEILNVKKGESLPWIKKIRDEIRTVMERHMILEGIPSFLKSKGISQLVMANTIDAVIDGGDKLCCIILVLFIDYY